MKTKRFFLIVIVALTLIAIAAPIFAQNTGDPDGDGVSSRIDHCPNEPGPAENNGCPLPPNGGIPDKDGDGVADFVDACPDEAGTGFTNGCPVAAPPPDAPPEVPPAQPQTVMQWQSTSECMVGVFGANTNIREFPTTSSAVIGQLAPGQQFAPYFSDYDENGELWFAGAPAGDSWGWVAGFVVINNGHCADLPMLLYVDAPDVTNPLMLTVNLSQLEPLAEDATSVPLSTIDLDLLSLDEIEWLVIGGEEPSMARRGRCRFCDFTFTHLYDKSSPVLDAGGGNPPATAPAPQPTSAPSPARMLPILTPMSELGEADCPAITGEYCLLMVLQLPDYGDAPGQCPADSAEKKRLAKLLEAAIKGKVFKKVEIHGTASPGGSSMPEVDITLAGDGSVMPVAREDSAANWDVGCAITGFVPTGEVGAAGDGSVRIGVEMFMLLPAVQGG